MNVSKLLVTSVAALSMAGAIGIAYAQSTTPATTPGASSTNQGNMQQPSSSSKSGAQTDPMLPDSTGNSGTSGTSGTTANGSTRSNGSSGTSSTSGMKKPSTGMGSTAAGSNSSGSNQTNADGSMSSSDGSNSGSSTSGNGSTMPTQRMARADRN